MGFSFDTLALYIRVGVGHKGKGRVWVIRALLLPSGSFKQVGHLSQYRCTRLVAALNGQALPSKDDRTGSHN